MHQAGRRPVSRSPESLAGGGGKGRGRKGRTLPPNVRGWTHPRMAPYLCSSKNLHPNWAWNVSASPRARAKGSREIDSAKSHPPITALPTFFKRLCFCYCFFWGGWGVSFFFLFLLLCRPPCISPSCRPPLPSSADTKEHPPLAPAPAPHGPDGGARPGDLFTTGGIPARRLPSAATWRREPALHRGPANPTPAGR